MIEKMKFVSLTGPREDIDRMVMRYLSKYDIHLENAMTELSDVHGLTPYVQTNPYKGLLAKANEYAALTEKSAAKADPVTLPLDEAIDVVRVLGEELTNLTDKRKELLLKDEELSGLVEKLTPFKDVGYDLQTILNFRYIASRFGRIPRDFIDEYRDYILRNTNTVTVDCSQDDEYLYGIYFAPRSEVYKVDAVFASLHFERFYLPKEYQGSPDEIYREIAEKKAENDRQIAELDEQMKKTLSRHAPALLAAREKLELLSANFDVRKMAACTKNNSTSDTFYIVCGWMAEEDVRKLREDTKDDKRVTLIEQETNEVDARTPTKLRNPKIFKPYEMYVKMYGLPNYREIDPTILVAVTYSFIFGIMYGDVGQGLCLTIFGFLLYKFKHIDLAGIIALAGISSTFFGFMFGSIFGFEDVIEAVWLRPREAMVTLPGVGSINTVLVCAIVFGMFLVLASMILHIINYRRDRNVEETFFSTNSVAGLIFYAVVVFLIIMTFSGHAVPAAGIFIALIVLSVLVMFFKEPLTKIAEKKKGPKIEGGIGMFIVQGFFEMFEVMLSFFSNTLSFVRIGAFAVSHAAMMSVVLMLAGAESGGNTNWIIVVLGNLFVMGIEGLIVGIQVLRLEFYEMFSRYYKGDGKEFVPSLTKRRT